jgi:hypothetical protein
LACNARQQRERRLAQGAHLSFRHAGALLQPGHLAEMRCGAALGDARAKNLRLLQVARVQLDAHEHVVQEGATPLAVLGR